MEGVIKFVILCLALGALFFGVSCGGKHYQVRCSQEQGLHLGQ